MAATAGAGVEVEDAGCCHCCDSRSANRWFSRSAAILLISSSSLIVFGVLADDEEAPVDDMTVVVVKEMPVGIVDLISSRMIGEVVPLDEISPVSAVEAAGPSWVSAVAASMRLNSEDMVESLRSLDWMLPRCRGVERSARFV